ncbi:MAG: exosortase-associated EpsI family protein [Victivallales bacterium]|nr:exosortase-associated EpsI family protein [Victivallales bacterium]
MKKPWKILSLALAMLPFIWELPYVFHAMAISPAERWNWCFLILALLLLLLAGIIASINDNLPKATGSSAWRFACLIPAVLLLLFGAIKHIHLAFLMGGILLPYTLACCLYGLRLALLLLPGCGMLALSCPSIGIILSTIFPKDGIVLKSILAALLSILFPCIAMLRIQRLKIEALAFAGLAILVADAYVVHGHATSRQPPLLPVFDGLISQHFRGVQDAVSAGDRQFFGDSNIKRFTFNDQTGNVIQVLTVSKIDNIHQIHPSTYCLRVSGYQILEEHTLHLPQEGEMQPMDVQEYIVERNGEKRIFWQWYSNRKYSTASFLLFRAVYSPAQNWSVYILDTSSTDTAATHLTLRTFIQENLPK